MVIGQNGVLGVILPNNIRKLGIEHATIQLQPMEDKIAHLE
jgi:hypothetical protein